jgi:transposase-like protein
MNKKPKSEVLEQLRNAAVSEPLSVVFLEKQRWGGSPECPRCGSGAVYQMRSRSGSRNKDFRWRCKGCERMFSVRTDTPLEETRLPLRVWVYCIWKAASSKKGISALQLSREMEITHKSALFVLRRLRHGLGEQAPQKLTGPLRSMRSTLAVVRAIPESQSAGAARTKRQSWVWSSVAGTCGFK